MADINIKVPGPEEPGYLRKMVRLAKIKDQMADDQRDRGDITADTLLMLVDFIAEFAVEVVPAEGENIEDIDVKEALMDLPKNQYEEIIANLGAVMVPKESGPPSEGSSPEVSS